MSSLSLVARAGALFCGWALVVVSLLTTAEVLARKFASISLQGVDELSAYVLALTAAFGFSWGLITKRHTRVDLVLDFFPVRVRAALNVLAAVLLAGFSIFLVWHGSAVLLDSIQLQSQANTPYRTPLAWPQSIWVFGLLIFAAVAMVAAAEALRLCLAGEWRRLNHRFGVQRTEEAVQEEIQELVLGDEIQTRGSS